MSSEFSLRRSVRLKEQIEKSIGDFDAKSQKKSEESKRDKDGFLVPYNVNRDSSCETLFYESSGEEENESEDDDEQYLPRKEKQKNEKKAVKLKHNECAKEKKEMMNKWKEHYEKSNLLDQNLNEYSEKDKNHPQKQRLSKKKASQLFKNINNNNIDEFINDWIKQFDAKNDDAFVTILNCIAEAAGYASDLFDINFVLKLSVINKEVEIHKFMNQYIASRVLVDEKIYPLMERSPYTTFKADFQNFFKQFVVLIDEDYLLQDKGLLNFFIKNLLIKLTFVQLRRLRYASVIALLSMVEGILLVFNKCKKSVHAFENQITAKCTNNKSVDNATEEMKKNISSMHKEMQKIKHFIESNAEEIFVYKFRDVGPEIRFETLRALRSYFLLIPDWFILPKYTKFAGLELSDPNELCKVCAIDFYYEMVCTVFKEKKSKQYGNDFINSHLDTIKMLLHDSSAIVQEKIINLATVMASKGKLNSNEMICFINVLWMTNDNNVLKSVANFINMHVFLHSVFREEETELEEVEFTSWGDRKSTINNISKNNTSDHNTQIRMIIMFLKEFLPNNQILLSEENNHIPKNNDASAPKLYKYVYKFVCAFWSKTPCLYNVRLMLEFLCLGEAEENSNFMIEEENRTALLYMCEASLRKGIQEILKLRNKKAKIEELDKLKKPILHGANFALNHANLLINLHKADNDQLYTTIAIMNSVCKLSKELHEQTNANTMDFLSTLLRFSKSFNADMNILRCCFSAISNILYFCKYFHNSMLSYVTDYFNELQQNCYKTLIDLEKSLKNEENFNLLDEKIKNDLIVFFQKLFCFYLVAPHDFLLKYDIFLCYFKCVKFRSDKKSTKENQILYTPPLRLILVCNDMLYLHYEKICYILLLSKSKRKNQKYLHNDNLSEKKNEGECMNEEDNNNKSSDETFINDKDSSNKKHTGFNEESLHQLYKNAETLRYHITSIFFSLLEFDDNIILKFGIFLIMMQIAKLEKIFDEDLSEDVNNKTCYVYKRKEFSEKEQSLLCETFKLFLRNISDIGNTRYSPEQNISNSNNKNHLSFAITHFDDIYKNESFLLDPYHFSSYSTPLDPFFSYIPPLDRAKTTAEENISENPEKSACERMHMAILSCRYIFNCFNENIWASRLGSLLLMQITNPHLFISEIAHRFMGILKKFNLQTFFDVLFQALEELYVMNKKGECEQKAVIGFCLSITTRLGISLNSTTKELFISFIKKCIKLALQEINSLPNFLSCIHPFATRHYLNSLEVKELKSYVKQEFENSNVKYENSEAENFMKLFLKNNTFHKDKAIKKDKIKDRYESEIDLEIEKYDTYIMEDLLDKEKQNDPKDLNDICQIVETLDKKKKDETNNINISEISKDVSETSYNKEEEMKRNDEDKSEIEKENIADNSFLKCRQQLEVYESQKVDKDDAENNKNEENLNKDEKKIQNRQIESFIRTPSIYSDGEPNIKRKFGYSSSTYYSNSLYDANIEENAADKSATIQNNKKKKLESLDNFENCDISNFDNFTSKLKMQRKGKKKVNSNEESDEEDKNGEDSISNYSGFSLSINSMMMNGKKNILREILEDENSLKGTNTNKSDVISRKESESNFFDSPSNESVHNSSNYIADDLNNHLYDFYKSIDFEENQNNRSHHDDASSVENFDFDDGMKNFQSQKTKKTNYESKIFQNKDESDNKSNISFADDLLDF